LVFDDTLAQILSLPQRKPAAALSPRLDALFRKLAANADDPMAFEIEDAIWEAWTGHADPDLAARMNQAIAAIAACDYDRGRTILNDLVARAPDYAEAWNKLATLEFLAGRDRESVAAIARALELEPRHFGAISGFAQICLRNGDPGSARLAFEAALRLNPRLTAVRIAVDELNRTHPATLH
jgi:tetratricopeptide (TPR) repeat protein